MDREKKRFTTVSMYLLQKSGLEALGIADVLIGFSTSEWYSCCNVIVFWSSLDIGNFHGASRISLAIDEMKSVWNNTIYSETKAVTALLMHTK